MEHKISRRSYVLPAIQNEIYELLKAEKWCDASVKGFTNRNDISNAGISCHQVVLAMASPVMRHALQKAMDGSKQICCCEQQTAIKDGCFVFDGQIILAGASNKVVESLIPFIYGKSIPENIELKAEITGWLNALKIEDYRHDRGVDSETEVLDDDTSDEISEVCDTSVPIKHHCIACKKKSFKCNEEKLYIQHLSAHKTAMLEQLKESKRNSDSNKKFFCDMCQTMVLGANYGAHIRQCFIILKEEMNKLSESQSSNKRNCDRNELPNKATSAPSHLFICSSCNKSFRYKLALKKHTCSKFKNESQRDHELDSATSASSHSTLNTASQMKPSRKTSHLSNLFDSSSEDEIFSRNSVDSNNKQKPNGVSTFNSTNELRPNQMRPTTKSKGRPIGNTKIPRLLIHRRSFGSGDCPDCGESYPNKEILKLHTCKSYLGLETENEYRTDRQNVELFGRTTQRRSLEESPPMSPVPKAKKKRTYRSRNRRSRSRSSPPKRTESRNSSKSQSFDTESSLNNPVSSTEDDEMKEPRVSFTAINRKSIIQPSTSCHPLKSRILSSIVQNETQFQESSETDDNGSIINRAINSLDKEMAKSEPRGLINNALINDNSQTELNASLKSNTTSRIEPYFETTESSADRIPDDTPKITQSKNIMANRSNMPQSDERQLEKNYLSCEQCGKPFLDQTKLTDHILEEHDSDPFD